MPPQTNETFFADLVVLLGEWRRPYNLCRVLPTSAVPVTSTLGSWMTVLPCCEMLDVGMGIPIGGLEN